MIDPLQMQQGFVSEMPAEVFERANASVRAEMPQAQTPGPMRSSMPASDVIESDPALSVYLSQSYQQQQAYFDTAKRIEIGGVGMGGTDQGILPPPFEASLLRPTQTIINMSQDGWKGILPYKPYVYHNFMWRQPQEQISIIW